MTAYKNYTNKDGLYQELEWADGLFLIETEERLEMVQAIESTDLSCCGDSGTVPVNPENGDPNFGR